jgi:hypothetical protein
MRLRLLVVAISSALVLVALQDFPVLEIFLVKTNMLTYADVF